MSRYGSQIATKVQGEASSITEPGKVHEAVLKLKQTFRSDLTLSKEWRVGQLNALLRLIEEGRDQLHKAMYQDLHKSPHECDMQELDFTIVEIHHALRHIDEWMKPQSVPVSAHNWPATGALVYDPLGVALIMGAWNYPVMLTLAPLVGAIAAGNCALIKPGSYAPATSNCMARLLHQYMDARAFVVCEGNRDVTEAILNEKLDVICFTGSTYVGKLVYKKAAENLTPVVLELGGKSPFVVDRTADLDMAAARLAWGSFMNSAQTCLRPDFVLVDEQVADKFIDLLRLKIKEMYGDDAQKTEWFGRIINHAAFDRLNKIVEESKDYICIGGRTDREDKFVEPTVFDYKSDSAAFDSCPAMLDENFGPVLPLLRYKNFEEDVIQRTRDLPTGKPLSFYCFTEDSRIVDQVTRRTTSGSLAINDCVIQVANTDLPFGGVGASGLGSYHGFRSFKSFSHEKSFMQKYSQIDQLPFLKDLLAARYPPFSPFRKQIAQLIANPNVAVVLEMTENKMVQQIIVVLLLLLVGRKLGFKLVRE